MLHFVYSTAYFPFTLTLSLREREQQASDGRLAYGRWGNSGTSVVSSWRTILPLLKGAGRGGETDQSPFLRPFISRVG